MSASLMWPPGLERSPIAELPETTAGDAGLDALVHALSLDHRHADRVRAVLVGLALEPAVTAFRQAVLADFLANPALCARLQPLLQPLSQLAYLGNPGRPRDTALNQVVYRLGELEVYVDCVNQLSAVLADAEHRIGSPGLLALREHVDGVRQDPSFRSLEAELPGMIERVRGIRSVTVGINLDPQLQPTEATLLSINLQKFKGSSLSLMARLLGGKVNPDNPETAEGAKGLAALHRVSLPEGMPATRENMMLVPLFRDLSELLEATARPVAQELMRYTRISGKALIALDGEIAFYLGAVRLIRRMSQAGMPMCRPEIRPADERALDVCGAYNLALALRMLERDPGTTLPAAVVPNDIAFDDAGRVFILTGPNRGGKTTYLQMLALVVIMAQAGLFVPATSARISPCDGIFTHFAAEEKPGLESGRLGEEARRLSEIFSRASRRSVILLNESLSSTSPTESLVLSRDVVRALRLLGARSVFATHLHALAEGIDAINADTPGDGAVASLVSQVDRGGAGAVRTFKIVRAPPQGVSYARDIAQKYGISFDQLEALIGGRSMPNSQAPSA